LGTTARERGAREAASPPVSGAERIAKDAPRNARWASERAAFSTRGFPKRHPAPSESQRAREGSAQWRIVEGKKRRASERNSDARTMSEGCRVLGARQ
jgi:hypothetical protein